MVILGVCALSVCGCGIKKKKQDVTLVVKTPVLDIYTAERPDIDSAEDFMRAAGNAFAESYEKANVSIKLELYHYKDIIKAVPDTFGTPDAVDVLYEDFHNMCSFIHTGKVVPLDGIITEEFRDDVYNVFWDMATVNGKTYMIPHQSRQNILIYNKDLFRAAGLDEYADAGTNIQNWSMEEWEDILDRLAQNLPENTYPMMMYAADSQGDAHIMSFIRAFGCPIFNEEGKFEFATKEGIEGLTWIKNGIERGWYPPHPENFTIIANQELFSAGQLAIMMFNSTTVLLIDSLEHYGFVNFPGNIATAFVTGFEVFDNGDEQKLQVAKDFVKYICETEEWMEISVGNIPVGRKLAQEYKDDILMLEEFANNSSNVVSFTNNSPNWQGAENSVRQVFYPHIRDMLRGSVTPEECAKALDKDCNAAIDTESILHE